MSTEGGQETPPIGSLHPDGEPPVPGSFREVPASMMSERTERVERTPEPHANLVAKYRLFREKLGPKSDVVYHPCGATDISPSAAFPDSRVIYADIDDEAMEALRKTGLEAHTASALEFDPGEVDVLIMLNPTISPDIPSSHVVEGGHVLCNDYHGTASDLRTREGYELAGMIRTGQGQELLWDTENLGDYWKEIETDEEFRNAPFDWGAVYYSIAAQVVEKMTGKKENILAEYRKIVEQAREEQRRSNEDAIREFTPATAEDYAQFGGDTEHSVPDRETQLEEYKAMLGDPDEQDVFVLNRGDRQFVIQATLPRKKGTVDDLFVFKKLGENKDGTTTTAQPVSQVPVE